MSLVDRKEDSLIAAGGKSKSVEQLWAVVHRYCLSLTGSRWDAEDLAQDTWLKAVHTLKGVGHTNPEAFLLRVAKNTWIDQSRRNSALARIVKHERPEATPPENGAFEIEAAFQALITHLSPLQTAVFLLRDVFGYSSAETAGMLATTEGAVKAALHRARRSLDAVKDALLSGALPQPEEEGLKAFLRALAAAYRMGDIATLVELVQRDEVEPAVAIAIAQNRLVGSSVSVRRTGSLPISQPNARMAA